MRSEGLEIGVIGIPGLKNETWGTRDLWMGRNKERPQVLRLPFTALRVAQDDIILWKACR
jgi:hypothetical protein